MKPAKQDGGASVSSSKTAVSKGQPLRFTLGKSERLIRSADFREAYDQDRKQVGKFVVLWQRNANDASNRLGVVASKKVGNAVHRNRAKRKIREVFRLNRHLLNTTDDIVIVARKTINEASVAEVKEDFINCCCTAGLIEKA